MESAYNGKKTTQNFRKWGQGPKAWQFKDCRMLLSLVGRRKRKISLADFLLKFRD